LFSFNSLKRVHSHPTRIIRASQDAPNKKLHLNRARLKILFLHPHHSPSIRKNDTSTKKKPSAEKEVPARPGISIWRTVGSISDIPASHSLLSPLQYRRLRDYNRSPSFLLSTRLPMKRFLWLSRPSLLSHQYTLSRTGINISGIDFHILIIPTKSQLIPPLITLSAIYSPPPSRHNSQGQCSSIQGYHRFHSYTTNTHNTTLLPISIKNAKPGKYIETW
jgi:hypothetical protein